MWGFTAFLCFEFLDFVLLVGKSKQFEDVPWLLCAFITIFWHFIDLTINQLTKNCVSDVSKCGFSASLTLFSVFISVAELSSYDWSHKPYFNEHDLHDRLQGSIILNSYSMIWFRLVGSLLEAERPRTSIQLRPIVWQCLLTLLMQQWSWALPMT